MSFKDLNNIWYLMNTKINFLNNINFSDNKKTWKIKNYLSTLHRIFPLDPTIHVALAKCYEIQNDIKAQNLFIDLAQNQIDNKKYWRKLFRNVQSYDKYNILANINY